MKLKCLAIVFVLGVIVGCGGNPRVTGKITFSDDNSPLTKGTVTFIKDGFTARAPINEKGEYSVSTETEGKGLPPGTYKVYLESTGTAKVVGGGVSIENAIDSKFENPQTSGLSLTVEKSQVFDFEVDRYSPTKKR